MHKPIKRHSSLQPLSREHHHALLLSWKIRIGLSHGIETQRIKKYADWFFENYLIPHFDMEEKFIFPILGKNHKSVRRALREHGRLRRLFNSKDRVKHNLSLIEEELVNHIRFEERVLFNEVQDVANESQLSLLQALQVGIPDSDNWNDKFWEKGEADKASKSVGSKL